MTDRRQFPRLAGDPLWDELMRAQNRAMNLRQRLHEVLIELEKAEKELNEYRKKERVHA